MANLVINPLLKNNLDEIAADPPNAILITGPKGSGKKSILNKLADDIANNIAGSKIMLIKPQKDKKHITIDQIKDIKSLAKTKDNSYRIVVMPDAELITLDAQNSMLKILEEPPKNFIFLLSSSVPQKIINTIRSRVINIKYVKPERSQLVEYLKKFHKTDAEVEKQINLARGRVGILASLNSESKSELLYNIEEAKEVLQEVPKDRLSRIDSLNKDNQKAIGLVEGLVIVSEAALEIAASKGNHKAWLARLDESNKAYELLVQNVATKLVLTRLFLVL